MWILHLLTNKTGPILISIIERVVVLMKKIMISALMGILSICAINLTTVFTGVSLPVSRLSIAAGAILGIPGVISMLMLKLVIK